MTTTETSLIVRYAETDAQGIVHHSNFLVWFEEGRSDYLRQQGLNYSDFEKSGYFVVVVEATTRYKAPAYYEDHLRIRTTLARAQGKILEFDYEVLNQAGTLLAEGRTLHLVLGRDRRPVALPEEFLAPLRPAGGAS
jgi:acyl-CoA thioester hydrolase